MTMRPTMRLQRLSALGLMLALVLALGSLLITPVVIHYQDRDTEIRALQKRTHDYRIAADSRPVLAHQIEQLRSDPRIASRHLKSASPALAGAELQQHIQKLAERHGARLVSMQIIKNDPDADLQAITVRIRLNADMAALQKLLFTLESENPLVTLDNVYVRTLGAVRSSDGTMESLDIGFDASGYTLGWSS